MYGFGGMHFSHNIWETRSSAIFLVGFTYTRPRRAVDGGRVCQAALLGGCGQFSPPQALALAPANRN